MRCYRKGCLACYLGKVPYCRHHERLSRMARAANYVYLPKGWPKVTMREVESLWKSTFPDDEMLCPACKVPMTWSKESQGITLQHGPDRVLSFLCFACNVRDANVRRKLVPYRARCRAFHQVKNRKKCIVDVPEGSKFCPACGTVKNRKDFGVCADAKDGAYPRCKECRRKKNVCWHSSRLKIRTSPMQDG